MSSIFLRSAAFSPVAHGIGLLACSQHSDVNAPNPSLQGTVWSVCSTPYKLKEKYLQAHEMIIFLIFTSFYSEFRDEGTAKTKKLHNRYQPLFSSLLFPSIFTITYEIIYIT